MIFADTHTHLYAREFDDDRDAVMDRAVEQNVKYIFLPAIDTEYHQSMLSLCQKHDKHCFPMMGLHPTSVKSNYKEELRVVNEYLDDPSFKFYGIGEIGIDLYWDKTFREEQVAAFRSQVELAIRYRLPAIIHTRNSFDIAVDILEKMKDQHLTGIFHCFGGNAGQADKATKLGFKLGIGGIITYKNSGLQQVVEVIGLEHLVLETDSPWLTPVPYRGQRNESAYIPIIAQKIAEIKKVSVEEVAKVTTGNALALFKIR